MPARTVDTANWVSTEKLVGLLTLAVVGSIRVSHTYNRIYSRCNYNC